MRSLTRHLPQRFIRPVAALTLSAFLLASVGYPVWSSGGSKDLSQPFPCMYRQCGCRNADQCWRGCCCFSNKQKLAWASANSVTPPQHVVAGAQRETAGTAKASCCASKNSGSCEKPAAARAGVELTAVIEALTCMVQLEQWVALGAIDVARAELWQLELPLSGNVACVSPSYSAVKGAPAPPPPWA